MNQNVGILNEQVLTLIFRRLNWDPQTLCSSACTSRRMRAVADRILFFELCRSRAPRLVSSLLFTSNGRQPASGNISSSPRIPGGWGALAKLLLFCRGCEPSKIFAPSDATTGHLTSVSRFSKTSGKSFLVRRCWGDALYVSDPCEHAHPAGEEELGIYRGIFGGFVRSRTRACLIGKNIQLDTGIRCPYCGARVWNMMAAGLIPKSASRRLGTHQDSLEYFVCVYGHLHGSCWLARLSSSDDADNNDDDDGGDDDHASVEPVAL